MNSLSKTGDIYISQSEFIGNLTAQISVPNGSAAGTLSSPFALESYELNPGMSKLFPFLSQIAQNYDLYELEGLIISYHPNSGETSVASNQLGKVIIATNYDPDCVDFINSIEMQNYDYANAGKPSVALVHGVETHPAQRGSGRMLYVRDSATAKDKVLTDIGKLFVATEGIPIEHPANSSGVDVEHRVILGELHVAYRVRLSRAKLYNSLLGYGIDTDRFKLSKTYTGTDQWFGTSCEAWVHNHGTWAAPVYRGTGLAYQVKANRFLVAGTYKWVLYIEAPAATTALNVTSVVGLNGCSVISTETDTGSYKTHAEAVMPAGGGGLCAWGYVTVNNTTDAIPMFEINMSRIAEAADASTFQKFSVTQISAKLTDATW